ncbi:hypothetical protein EI94DRAFT_588551 [Lactarius quietus]|nr:hypothetical protein EI94DRAFT_588551 [Lactarius quietus]
MVQSTVQDYKEILSGDFCAERGQTRIAPYVEEYCSLITGVVLKGLAGFDTELASRLFRRTVSLPLPTMTPPRKPRSNRGGDGLPPTITPHLLHGCSTTLVRSFPRTLRRSSNVRSDDNNAIFVFSGLLFMKREQVMPGPDQTSGKRKATTGPPH